jgi:myo-inositol-1(or 4)-monophosphatase
VITAAALDERRDWAQAVVRDCGRMALDLFDRDQPLDVRRKAGGEPASRADRDIDAFFRRRLAQAFPADGIISEEGEDRAGDADAVWIVDPVDGTRNFLHGSSHWCVSVALAVGRRLVIGLVYDPVLDELFAAARGGGATRNGRPLAVSPQVSLAGARIGFGFARKSSAAPIKASLTALVDHGAALRLLGTAALSLAHVAAGRLDAYFQYDLHVWDCAAGMLLVEEAGGRIGELPDGRCPRECGPLLAAAPGLADELGRITGIAMSAPA